MSAKLNAFIEELRGRRVEFAGAPQNQCVDLVNLWLHRNGQRTILHRNAIDFQKGAPGLTFIKNTDDYLPPLGAIAVYSVGAYGHVDIVAPGTDVTNLFAFSQNWPVGAVCQTVVHRNYASVVGFLVWDGLAQVKMPISEVVGEVIAGKWGNGEDRKNRLEAAGYNYAEVQAAVNAKVSKPSAPAKKTNSQIADEVIKGKWGNGSDRTNRLKASGYDPAAIQSLVNSKLKK